MFSGVKIDNLPFLERVVGKLNRFYFSGVIFLKKHMLFPSEEGAIFDKVN